MAELTRATCSPVRVLRRALALGAVDEAESASDLSSWAGVRAQFALDRDRVHLASFLLAAHRDRCVMRSASSARTDLNAVGTCTRTRHD
jgi:hypothetical protein